MTPPPRSAIHKKKESSRPRGHESASEFFDPFVVSCWSFARLCRFLIDAARRVPRFELAGPNDLFSNGSFPASASRLTSEAASLAPATKRAVRPGGRCGLLLPDLGQFTWHLNSPPPTPLLSLFISGLLLLPANAIVLACPLLSKLKLNLQSMMTVVLNQLKG